MTKKYKPQKIKLAKCCGTCSYGFLIKDKGLIQCPYATILLFRESYCKKYQRSEKKK